MAEVYITGVAGFLGRNVANLFMNAGYSVAGCDDLRMYDGEDGTTKKKMTIPEGLEYFEKEDINDLRTIPPGTKYLIHTAAIARSAWDNDDELYEVNFNGTTNVMGMAQNEDCVIVHASSCVVQTPDINAYAHSKYLAEGVANLAGAVSLRFSNIYGPGQNTQGSEPNILARWQRDYREKKYVEIHGTGEQTRDFLHVSDAAYAVYLAAHYGFWLEGRAVDVCTGVQTSVASLAALCGFPHTFTEGRANDPQSFPQDNSEMYRTVGWTPRVGLSNGLKKMGLVNIR